MGVSELVELLVKRRDHVGMTVAEAGHRGAAGRIDIGLAVLVEQFDALAADGDGHFGIGGAMKNMGHDDFLVLLLSGFEMGIERGEMPVRMPQRGECGVAAAAGNDRT